MGDRTRLFSDSSSSDSEGPGAAARTLPPLRFQKKRVREFISELQHPNKLGPTFFSDDDVKEWDSWNSEVPERVSADVHDDILQESAVRADLEGA